MRRCSLKEDNGRIDYLRLESCTAPKDGGRNLVAEGCWGFVDSLIKK